MRNGTRKRMNAEQARALLFQRKVAYKNFDGEIPGIPELKGELGILELPARELVKATKGENESDEALQLATIVAQALVMRGSKERVFSDTDIEAVAGFGLSILRPIAEEVNAVSGVTPEMVEHAKKN
jgi:hypothetical protein